MASHRSGFPRALASWGGAFKAGLIALVSWPRTVEPQGGILHFLALGKTWQDGEITHTAPRV